MVDQRMVFGRVDVKVVLDYARRHSPCIRRKYGVLIMDSLGEEVIATNYRVGNYCKDSFCIRDYCKVPHGEKVELGGEIHAEQAALTKYSNPKLGPDQFKHILVAAVNHMDQPLLGMDNLPCHVCAMMIKFAGFNYVWMPFPNDDVIPMSIDQILEYYERLD